MSGLGLHMQLSAETQIASVGRNKNEPTLYASDFRLLGIGTD